MKLRPADTRGVMTKSWITSLRTFSNNDYWNPKYMNWGVLEVINDDILQPGHAVSKHEHKNMEILGYVVQGPCHHRDSRGNDCVAESGSVQRMSSGSSIWHTEGNQTSQPIRYLQLWIRPSVLGTPAEYTQQHFSREQKLNTFCLIASSTGPIVIKQQAQVWAGIFTENYTQPLNPQRKYYLYLVLGTASINDLEINEGDGIAIENVCALSITNPNQAELILFEV